MTTFSANLGFLWTELSLTDAIHAAKSAGFDAVECHWPYDTPAKDVAAALKATDLPMLGINTRRGKPGENGLSALHGRKDEARAAVDEALKYASQINAQSVHVMAGIASGMEAHFAFLETLSYACTQAKALGVTILIEPLNTYDAPGYFLQTTDQAVSIIEEVGADNLRLMFDCYHVQRMEGDITNKLTQLLPYIGHVQFANAPARSAPDQGEINFAHIFNHLETLGYAKPLGAEYKPNGPTETSLGWLNQL